MNLVFVFMVWGSVSGVICGLLICVCRDIGGMPVYRGVEYGGEGCDMGDVSGVCAMIPM